MLTQTTRHHAKAGSEAEYIALNGMVRWLWRCMHQARAAKRRLDAKDPNDNWARGYSTGVATATKIVLRDVLRTRRVLSERVRS